MALSTQRAKVAVMSSTVLPVGVGLGAVRQSHRLRDAAGVWPMGRCPYLEVQRRQDGTFRASRPRRLAQHRRCASGRVVHPGRWEQPCSVSVLSCPREEWVGVFGDPCVVSGDVAVGGDVLGAGGEGGS